MKKTKSHEMRHEYRREDLGKGVRGKHLKAYRDGTNLVLLRPEVAVAFPTSEAVNDALSSLIQVAKQSIGLARRAKPQKDLAILKRSGKKIPPQDGDEV